MDELVRQALGGESTALSDRREANLLRVTDALVEVGEGLAVVQVGRMNDMSGSSQLVGEGEEAGCLSLGVVKQEYLGHHHGVHNMPREPLETNEVAHGQAQ
jgi:hypothetical protein